MGSLYDRADIYDLLESDARDEAYKQHWMTILKSKNIHTMLDVSIGSGSVTLPVLDLNIQLSGSDLSETMLANCAKKVAKRNADVTLNCSDFRDLSCQDGSTYDLVASTGNSLAYVNNEDVCKTLEQMDHLVAPGGYLYFDSRNWEKITREHNRFYLYNPVFLPDSRMNLVQVWDYNLDGSMTFNLLYAFEQENRIVQKEHFEEHYHPFPKDLAVETLKRLGYHDFEIKAFPSQFSANEFEQLDWYSLIAKKIDQISKKYPICFAT